MPNFWINESLPEIQVLLATKVEILEQGIRLRAFEWGVVGPLKDPIQLFIQVVVPLVEPVEEVSEELDLFDLLLLDTKGKG